MFEPLRGFILDCDNPPHKFPLPVFVFQKHPMINYYHLIIEQLPGLLMYKKHLEGFGVQLAIFSNGFEKLISEVIDLLKIDRSLVLFTKETFITAPIVYKLDAQEVRNECPKFLTAATNEFFALMTSGHVVNKKRRIFISRKDSPKRSMTNEKEVMSFLREYGFEEVVLTGMSLQKQINLFSDCEAVVGAHGAGLTNIGFCHRDTFILEITKIYTLERIRIFWDIAAMRGLDYSLICAEDDTKDHAAPFSAPMDSLKKIIESKFTSKCKK
jgi:capsular polysaccharide biosynthesis protein